MQAEGAAWRPLLAMTTPTAVHVLVAAVLVVDTRGGGASIGGTLFLGLRLLALVVRAGVLHRVVVDVRGVPRTRRRPGRWPHDPVRRVRVRVRGVVP